MLDNEIPSITLTNNEGKLISINDYVQNIYKEEWEAMQKSL